MAAHQAPPSLGFSRQEHWSGLPFPSPMHESEKLKVKVKSLSRVRPLAWTAAYQAPPSMGFFRQESWSGVPLPSPSTGVHNAKNSYFCVEGLDDFFLSSSKCSISISWMNKLPLCEQMSVFFHMSTVEFIIKLKTAVPKLFCSCDWFC